MKSRRPIPSESVSNAASACTASVISASSPLARDPRRGTLSVAGGAAKHGVRAACEGAYDTRATPIRSSRPSIVAGSAAPLSPYSTRVASVSPAT
jgi:hypothetical protein